MIIEEVHVKNLMSLKDAKITLDQLTALVGRNGTGKSTFLYAIRLFYGEALRIRAEDLYNEDTSLEISIQVTYSKLSKAARERFTKYAQGDSLTVERIVRWEEDSPVSTLHGFPGQASGFLGIRALAKTPRSAKPVQELYDELRGTDTYQDLPDASRHDDRLLGFEEWEAAHPDQLQLALDDGKFFDWSSAGKGNLGSFTKLIFIPAVSDASELVAEGKGSPLTELVNLVVRSKIASNQDLEQLRDDTKKGYHSIIKESMQAELTELRDQLSDTLTRYVPDADFVLDWDESLRVSVPDPRVQTKLVEDGFPTWIGNTGHGLQRACILTLLEYLAIAQQSAEARNAPEEVVEVEEPTEFPDLVLLIEEPEMYQHPSRQRHFAKVLWRLADGRIPGITASTQVLFATHSPLFISFQRVHQVRLLRKLSGNESEPRTTTVQSTTLDEIAERVWLATDQKATRFTGKTIAPRLEAVMTPWMNEGFFADTVVLVEGPEDWAVILAVAYVRNIDLESEGISVIPCFGKGGLDKPAVVFGELRIPTYVIWDSDRRKKHPKPEPNRLLLRLHGQPIEDWPSRITEAFACFEIDLRTKLREEIGEETFDAFLKSARDELGFSKKQGLKNAAVMRNVIESAALSNCESVSMNTILDKIVALTDPSK